jgi:hypothetical protein
MTLAELQKRMGAAIMAPLARHDEISTDWRREADELIKPNDLLSPLERLQIYSRSYWFRIIDCFYEDFAGLAAAIGPRAFDKLARAYLADRPSQSYALRNLGEGLEAWLRAHPEYAGRHLDLAIDMIRIEWAHIEAFDGLERKPLGPEDLLQPGPGLRAGLQPYLSLLELHYPVGDLRIEVNEWLEEHEDASNAPSAGRLERNRRRAAARRYRRLKPRTSYLAVYRSENVVYYRRLEPGEFQLLRALGEGKTVGEALDELLDRAAAAPEQWAANVQNWFTEWAKHGWLTTLSPAAQ